LSAVGVRDGGDWDAKQGYQKVRMFMGDNDVKM
jgi:hypothetical protein